MAARRPSLLSELPEGFRYHPNFLTEPEESELLERIRSLSFENFDFHGYIAKRRIVQYGMEYSSTTRKAVPTDALPDYLLPFRDRAAQFAGIQPESLVESIVTEYPPGAPIGSNPAPSTSSAAHPAGNGSTAFLRWKRRGIRSRSGHCGATSN
jgi:alkylated DNA repair dioxygenase AlkB